MVRISFDKISLPLFFFSNLSMSMILICLLLECSEWNLCYFHYCYFSSYHSFKIGIFKMYLLCWIHESYVLKIVELDISYTDINHNICPYSCNLVLMYILSLKSKRTNAESHYKKLGYRHSKEKLFQCL